MEIATKYIIQDSPPSIYTFKEILPKAAKCKICGGDAMIYGWNDGIGDICCSVCKITYFGCHYSGKFCTTKKQAIRKWNEVNNGD